MVNFVGLFGDHLMLSLVIKKISHVFYVNHVISINDDFINLIFLFDVLIVTSLCNMLNHRFCNVFPSPPLLQLHLLPHISQQRHIVHKSDFTQSIQIIVRYMHLYFSLRTDLFALSSDFSDTCQGETIRTG